MLTPIRMLACAAAAAAALAISACGGDGGGVDSDNPASLAPADAPIYIQATVRPKGRVKTDVETLASTVSGFDDPTGRLISLFEEATNEEPTASGKRISFDQDVDPWLGNALGVFVEGFTEDPGAVIIQTADPDAARRFVEDSMREEGDREKSYEGTDYVFGSEDGEATGMVDDFLVYGDEAAFKRAVDVAGGEDSLGDQDDFTTTLDEAPENSIADVYVSVEEIANRARAESPEDAGSVQAAIGETEGKTALASLVPSADSLELDFATNAESQIEFADLSALIETFPADSFAAFGIPDLGGIVNRTIDQLEDSGVEGINREAIDQQLSQTGLSIDDVTRALGDLGVFATGTDEASLQGAAVIASEDPEAAQNLISKLTAITGLAQLSGNPKIRPAPVGSGISITDREELGAQPLVVTTEGDRIAIGYGEQATEQALAGGGATLADDPTFQQAVKALGGNGLSGYVAFPAVFRLAESLGATADPGYRQAKRYIDKLTYGVFGSGEQGDFSNSKVIVGVRP